MDLKMQTMNYRISILKSADKELNSREYLPLVDVEFKFQEHKEQFARALETFLKLIHHDLAVLPDNDKSQWGIVIMGDQLFMQEYPAKSGERLNGLSPLFSSSSNGLMAIEDLGTGHLINMFKMLKGVHE